MSTRHPRDPGDPSEDRPDEAAASVPDARPAGTSAAQPHDALFRQIFGDPAQAAVVLRSILPPRVAAHIDWNTPFEPTHASMVGKDAEQRHADLLFKIRLVDGRGSFLWVIFEHQSTVQRWMPLDLSGMVQDFLDEWHRRNPDARYVPAVLPVVLHHGPRPWRAPTSLLELTDLSEQQRADFAAHLLSLDFVLDDLRTVPDEDIDARPLGPLVRLVLGIMKHCRSPDLLASYLAQFLREDLRNEIRDEIFEKAIEKGFEKSFEKGFEKGVEKGQRELLLRLLTERFGSLPAAIASRVAGASRDQIDRWAGRIFKAASLDDVFAS